MQNLLLLLAITCWQCHGKVQIIEYLKGLYPYSGPKGLTFFHSPKKDYCNLQKGRIFVVMFADGDRYLKLANSSCISALEESDVDAVGIVSKEFIDNDFAEANKYVLEESRGAGLWLWKPYLIFRLLYEFLETDDTLFYMDTDFKLVKPLESVIKLQVGLAKENINVIYVSL